MAEALANRFPWYVVGVAFGSVPVASLVTIDRRLAQGVWASVFTLAGVGAGVLLDERRTREALLGAAPDTPGEKRAAVMPAARAAV